MRLILVALLAMLATACAPTRRGNLIAAREADHGLLDGTFATLDADIARADRDGPIVGGQLAIAHNGALVYSNTFGSVGMAEKSPPIDRATLFDTASLAKPLAGVPLSILLDGKHPGDARVGVLRMHRGGLDDEVVMPTLRELILSDGVSSLLNGLRNRGCYRYANSGYVLIGLFAAEFKEERLRDDFWNPLGGDSITFAPSQSSQVAVSGVDKAGNALAGQPYDPLAAFMLESGVGLPAHSGLFATAESIALVVSRLEAESGGPRGEWRRLLLGPVTSLPRCDGFGSIWITEGGMISPTTLPYAPDLSIPGRIRYHTGYTGCLLWIDSRSGMTMALLTNASLTDSTAEFEALSRRLVMRILQGSRQD